MKNISELKNKCCVPMFKFTFKFCLQFKFCILFSSKEKQYV